MPYICQKCGAKFEHIFLPQRSDKEEQRLWQHAELCGGQLTEDAPEIDFESDSGDSRNNIELFADLTQGESPIVRQWMKMKQAMAA